MQFFMVDFFRIEPPIFLSRWFLAQGIHEKGSCVSRSIMEDPVALHDVFLGGERLEKVIKDLEDWRDAYKHHAEGFKDLDAIECIEKALEELEKYYTHFGNEDFRKNKTN